MKPAGPKPVLEIPEHSDETALRGFVGYNLKRAYLVLQPGANAALARLDLRILSFSCLSMIVGNPGVTPSRLAELLQMEHSNLVVIIDDFEARELVTRTRMESDRRRYALAATARGRRLQGEAAAAVRRAEERLLSAFAADELEQLCRLLARIEAAGSGRFWKDPGISGRKRDEA